MSSLSEQKPMRLWPSPIVYCEERGLVVSINAISVQPILTSQTLHAAQSLITLCLPPALSLTLTRHHLHPKRMSQVNQQDARSTSKMPEVRLPALSVWLQLLTNRKKMHLQNGRLSHTIYISIQLDKKGWGQWHHTGSGLHGTYEQQAQDVKPGVHKNVQL